jgi:hypothetical protein
MTTFAHAHDDDATSACQHGQTALRKTTALSRLQAQQGLRFYVQRVAGQLQGALSVEGGITWVFEGGSVCGHGI